MYDVQIRDGTCWIIKYGKNGQDEMAFDIYSDENKEGFEEWLLRD
jgi:hypothetical protein